MDEGSNPAEPTAGTVFERAYREAMDRLKDRPSTLSTRTPEEWAELDRILMTDDPVNLGDPGRAGPAR